VALDGTAPVLLCNAPDPRGGAWSPNDVIVFAPNNTGGIDRVSANGGDPVSVTHVDGKKDERGHRYPQFLPDGKHFLYVAIGQKGEIVTWAASLDGGAPVEIQRGGTMARYAPPGYLLSFDDTQQTEEHRLLVRRFDAGSLRAAGDPMLVVDRVTTNNFGYSNATASSDGNLVVQHAAPQHAKLEWWDNAGHLIGPAVDDMPGFGAVVSPNGRELAYGAFDPQDLFVRDIATGASTRLTFEKKPIQFLVWSPDGRRLAFARLTGNQGWEIHVKSADGSGPDSLVFHGAGLFAYPASWSKDGRWLLAQCSDSSGSYDLWKIPMAGQGAASPYQRTPGQEQVGSFSPDGNWIVYVVDEGGQNFVYVQSFPDPGTKYQIDVPDAVFCGWLDGGDQVLVANRSNSILSVPVSVVGGFHAGAARKLFTVPSGRFVSDGAHDGSRFLLAVPLPPAEPPRLEVILGWPALLAHR
jgi:WD40 repeat protein